MCSQAERNPSHLKSLSQEHLPCYILQLFPETDTICPQGTSPVPTCATPEHLWQKTTCPQQPLLLPRPPPAPLTQRFRNCTNLSMSSLLRSSCAPAEKPITSHCYSCSRATDCHFYQLNNSHFNTATIMGAYFLSWSHYPWLIHSYCCFDKGWMHEVALPASCVQGNKQNITFHFSRSFSSKTMMAVNYLYLLLTCWIKTHQGGTFSLARIKACEQYCFLTCTINVSGIWSILRKSERTLKCPSSTTFAK